MLLIFFSNNISAETNILWQNQSSGDFVTWLMEGTDRTGQALLGNQSTNWKIVGTGDFNSDGKPDILWRHPLSGQNYVWLMDGTTITEGSQIDPVLDLNWRIVGPK